MKKVISVLIILILLVGCASTQQGSQDSKKIVLGVVGEHYKYWDPTIEQLKKEGIDLELKVFSEYSIPNRALSEKDIDINAFQHYAYLEQEISESGYALSVLGESIIDPLGIYSHKIDDIKGFEGGKIIIPNDVTNGGRALKLLEAAGLIELDPSKGFLATTKDITKNIYNANIEQVEASLSPSMLDDVDLAVINGDLAISSGLTPQTDSIYREDVDTKSNPNADQIINVIVVREEDKDKEEYQRIIELFQSSETIAVIDNDYGGAFIPAWK